MKEKDPTEEEEEEEGPLSEVIRLEDAYWFPLIGSVVLLSLYLIIRYISVIWLNILLRFYFAATSVASIWTVGLFEISYFRTDAGVDPAQYFLLFYWPRTMEEFIQTLILFAS